MIFAIETSCDDSAVALMDDEGNLVSHEISSQIPDHEKYGGVVPEIASRSHLVSLPRLIKHILKKNSIRVTDISCFAVTSSPGLIGSLLVGVSYAKTLAWIAGASLISVDHLEGHLLAPFLTNRDLDFPYVALIASGGHTHLVHAHALGKYSLLGKTLDDAAGEAFDKVAKMLGFKYPGGPIIDEIAQTFDKPDIVLPIPLQSKNTLNFSYSGLKTAVRNHAIQLGILVENKPLIGLESFLNSKDEVKKEKIKNLLTSFQRTMAQTIEIRCQQALKKLGIKRLVLTGGVAANSAIRKTLTSLSQRENFRFYCPPIRFCTDNAAMIAYTAWIRKRHGLEKNMCDLKLNPYPTSPLNRMEVDKQSE